MIYAHWERMTMVSRFNICCDCFAEHRKPAMLRLAILEITIKTNHLSIIMGNYIG